MAEETEVLEAIRPAAMSGRCGAGPCGYHYDTGGTCSGVCDKLVDDNGNHTMAGGHCCQFGHSF